MLLLALLGSCANEPSRGEGSSHGAAQPAGRTVILVGVDGYRWDYIDRRGAGSLRRLAAEGVRAQALIPVFPTKTAPNLHTMVTGLYPEAHGVLANQMYDPRSRAVFVANSSRESFWFGGEPIWITAERQGIQTGLVTWPGADVVYQGKYPSRWLPYDGTVPNATRIAQVLAWLDVPVAVRPRFIAVYISDTDDAGHQYGPGSWKILRAIAAVDASIEALVEGLNERDLLDDTDVVVVSDHGMTDVSPERTIFLDDYVDRSDLLWADLAPVTSIWPRPSRMADVHRRLARAHPRLDVYLRSEIPQRWRYRAHERVPPILAVAAEGWSVAWRHGADTGLPAPHRGNHGYDNALPSMQGIFVARGPSFPRGVVLGRFSSIELYSLLTAALGIQPAPHQGTPGFPCRVLRPSPARPACRQMALPSTPAEDPR